MSNKNEVFEYLIDQLRQQVNKKDVTSFNVSVQISDLDEVKQVIHNLQQHIAGRDDEIRVLKDTLRQQVNNNQCEDLAREVQSLKNQLRDASALVAEFQKGASIPSMDSPGVNSAAWKLYDALAAKGDINGAQFNILKAAFHDAMLVALGKGVADTWQSGCHKEDTQKCAHSYCYVVTDGFAPFGTKICETCGRYL